MGERKEIPVGIVVFVIFALVFAIGYLFYLVYYLMISEDSISMFFSFSYGSLVLWINVLLTVFSLLIIPYGLLKRKNWARIYAVVFFCWFALETIGYIVLTGEKLISFSLFVMYVVFVIYLLMSSVKNYFNSRSSLVEVPPDIMKEFTYGEYTLYTKLVRLKNEKLQVIYFFSKHRPKSGEPCPLPGGYDVGVNTRSGLPYLKKG